MFKHACVLCKIVLALVVIGALNWGMIGIFGINVVQAIFGMGVVSNIIYGLVGLSGLALLVHFFKGCKSCDKDQSCSKD
ncbi:MAG: DUF378 domain-containing protein [Verrucomicrobia bacterium]|nr:DUF378 domain-containing protein [Verrucomicrobiota bacterium]